MYSLAEVEILLPLFQTVAMWLDIYASEGVVLEQFHFLTEDEGFMQAYREAVANGIEEGLHILKRVKHSLVKKCKENTHLTKALAKGIFRYISAKTVAKNAAKLSTHSAGIVSDLIQGAFEYAGYNEEGKAIGMWGNIVTAAAIGFTAGGPLGVPVGVLVGYGSWLFGEVVDDALHENQD